MFGRERQRFSAGEDFVGDRRLATKQILIGAITWRNSPTRHEEVLMVAESPAAYSACKSRRPEVTLLSRAS